ncbi:MAG: nicotinate-nucleotide adenylyltransferase [Paramuribaculum sp.]|nr:nicotinate-nucleotide adenylyltransferase [Paramuribaculum sp.]
MTLRSRIGILGGSFNPVHLGHIQLADYLVQTTQLTAVWLMLSPRNPLKQYPADMPSDEQRMDMLRIAAEATPRLEATDIELSMPRPSYTIDSLRRLRSLHPDVDFSLVIGSDNWLVFDQWRDYRSIIDEFSPVIYPRPGYPVDTDSLPEGVTLVSAPMLDISSTQLREAIAAGLDMNLFLPAGVMDYILTNNLYRL